MALLFLALSHTYDLQIYLESIGSFKRENKQAVNRTLAILNRIYTNIITRFRNSKDFTKNVPLFCDMFAEAVDSHIYLCGLEREMNIITFCCEKILEHCRWVNGAHVLPNIITTQAKDVAAIPVLLSRFQFEKYDLSFIFNQQLDKLYD